MKEGEKMDALFAKNNKDRILSTEEIENLVLADFPDTNRTSILPADYCYNSVNIGIKFDHHLFEKLSRGKYKVLGKNYSFEGDIFWQEKKCECRKVGEWRNGSPGIYEEFEKKLKKIEKNMFIRADSL